MKNKLGSFLLIVFGVFGTSQMAEAQTARKVIIEHFTNTNCGICGSRNPALFTNLETSPEVLHMAVHPSRPYASCAFSKHNPTENDDRTKYYDIYGGTPRVVVQGEVKPNNTNFGDKSFFSSAQGNESPAEIKLNTIKKDNDSLVTQVVIKTTADHTLTNLNIYLVAAEDTVFYSAPNGEKQHYNVFRKVLVNESVTLPSTVGDSVILYAKTDVHTDWESSRMFVIAMLQHNDTKMIEQANWSKGDEAPVVLSTSAARISPLQIYPNPASQSLHMTLSTPGVGTYQLVNAQGQAVQSGTIDGEETLALSEFSTGIYFVVYTNSAGTFVQRFIKE